MPKESLGRWKTDVDSENINADGCGVTDAECVALGTRMALGEFKRLKILSLVSIFSFLFLYYCLW